MPQPQVLLLVSVIAAGVLLASSGFASAQPAEITMKPIDPGTYTQYTFSQVAGYVQKRRHSHATGVYELARYTTTDVQNPNEPVTYDFHLLHSFGMQSDNWDTCQNSVEQHTVARTANDIYAIQHCGNGNTLPCAPMPFTHCRHGHTMTILNGLNAAIIFGGHKQVALTGLYQQRFQDTNEVLVYDLLTDSFVVNFDKSPIKPEPRREHTAVTLDGAIYIYGGIADAAFGNPDLAAGGAFRSDVWKFDAVTRMWSMLNQGGGPGGRFGHTSVSYANSGFLTFGGIDVSGNQRDDMWFFEKKTTSWHEVEVMSKVKPTPRFDHIAFVALAARVMIVHGGDHAGQVLNDLWYYDIECKTWYMLDPNGNAGARAKHTGVIYMEDSSFLFGGRNNANSALDTLFMYETSPEPQTHECFSEIPNAQNNYLRSSAESMTCAAALLGAGMVCVML